MWLNPPFGQCNKFAEKSRNEMLKGARILMLTPASVGSEWYSEFVKDFAHSIALRPRLVFEGETSPYPKDLMLTVFHSSISGFSTWRWK
jgi:hypothetical protein